MKLTKSKCADNTFSKRLSKCVFWGGFFIVQECILLIAFAIYKDFTATAAYLTAAIAVGEAMITVVANKYLSLAQSEHCIGGITYAAAEANNFNYSQETQEDKTI
ncbi:MAG: hypothetical protein RR365_00865 [Bacteroides sp.]